MVRSSPALPVLHLNGYKISNPTILACIPHEELASLLTGYSHKSYFVGSDDLRDSLQRVRRFSYHFRCVRVASIPGAGRDTHHNARGLASFRDTLPFEKKIMICRDPLRAAILGVQTEIPQQPYLITDVTQPVPGGRTGTFARPCV
jgi:hypothetical protein